MQRKNSKILGMSLIEVVTVAAIIGILTAMTIPSFRSGQQDAKAEQWAMELMDSIKFARMAAYRSNAIRLCGATSPPDTSCQTTYVNGWTTQFMNQGSYAILQANPRAIGSSDIAITLNGVATTGNINLFNAGGYPAYSGTLIWTIKPSKCNTGMQVTLDANGNLSSAQVTCP